MTLSSKLTIPAHLILVGMLDWSQSDVICWSDFGAVRDMSATSIISCSSATPPRTKAQPTYPEKGKQCIFEATRNPPCQLPHKFKSSLILEEHGAQTAHYCAHPWLGAGGHAQQLHLRFHHLGGVPSNWSRTPGLILSKEMETDTHTTGPHLYIYIYLHIPNVCRHVCMYEQV